MKLYVQVSLKRIDQMKLWISGASNLLENSVNPRGGTESNISYLFFSRSTCSVECSLGIMDDLGHTSCSPWNAIRTDYMAVDFLWSMMPRRIPILVLMSLLSRNCVFISEMGWNCGASTGAGDSC